MDEDCYYRHALPAHDQGHRGVQGGKLQGAVEDERTDGTTLLWQMGQ